MFIATGKMYHTLTFLMTLLAICPTARAQETEAAAEPGSVVAELAKSVDPLLPLIETEWTKNWVRSVAQLPSVDPKSITLGEKSMTADEGLFYYNRYGSPLAYARALDLACQAGFKPQAGTRVFDFGYGSIGHLRMLALNGCHATGVDVEPLLKAMYADASGPLGDGSVKVLDGKFPAEAPLIEQAGGEYDLFLSKNTLKRGYIHPSREVGDKRMIIELGVDDAAFLKQMHTMLKPGGLVVLYNFCPPKAADDKPYIPWADGESPFTAEQWTAAGFEIVQLDVVDDTKAREVGKALGWDAGMKLETDLFAWYTIVQKPAE